MRHDHRLNSDDAEAIAYTFHFQMTNDGGRQACSVRVRAPNVDEARIFFRQNWSTIKSWLGIVWQAGLAIPDNQAGQSWRSEARPIDPVFSAR